MARGDKYFTFPLSVLRGHTEAPAPTECLHLAKTAGVINAAIGMRDNLDDDDEFHEKFYSACDEHFEIPEENQPDPFSHEGYYILGAQICGMTLPSDFYVLELVENWQEMRESDRDPLIRMSSSSLWAAINQARFEDDPIRYERPDHGLSWREFRILAAILSWPQTREGFTSIGWESIQFRASGFVSKKEFAKAKRIPDHLPKLSRRQIRDTLDTLEELKMFARFRLSTGARGGRMIYSFRHTREELAEAVCAKVNFQDRARVSENRIEDARKCLELLERAKSGTSPGQGGGQGGGQVGGQHNEKCTNEKCTNEKYISSPQAEE